MYLSGDCFDRQDDLNRLFWRWVRFENYLSIPILVIENRDWMGSISRADESLASKIKGILHDTFSFFSAQKSPHCSLPSGMFVFEDSIEDFVEAWKKGHQKLQESAS